MPGLNQASLTTQGAPLLIQLDCRNDEVSHAGVVEAHGVLSGLAGDSESGLRIRPAEAGGGVNAASFGQVAGDLDELLLGQVRAGWRRSPALGEAQLFGGVNLASHHRTPSTKGAIVT